MKFTERLIDKLEPVWQQNHHHPFVTGMGDGTLDPAKFRFFMIQDYLYLIEYAKLFALGVVKAKDVATMSKFATLLESTLNTEMSLHRAYCAKFDITEEELAQAEHAPTTLAYSHYMLHVSSNGTLADLVAALLPCMWSYWEIGKALSRIPGAIDHPLYGEWIAMYSSPEFEELTHWCLGLMDELTEGMREPELLELERIFLNTTRFEYLFWDMAYHQQSWPVAEQEGGEGR